jgi:hypothetical protein
MSSSFQIEFKTKGKLFKNPRPKDAIKKALEKIALVTEARVKKELYPGHGVKTGYLRRSVSGEVISDLKAQIDAGEFRQGANIVYTDWVEGVSSRNARSTFRGYKMFEKAKKEFEKEDKDKYFEKPIKDELG